MRCCRSTQAFRESILVAHLRQAAAQAVTTARDQVAALIGAKANEMIFTGCATEANNLALLGAARAAEPRKRHVVISAVEHPAVTAPAKLEAQGWRVSVVPVGNHGRVSPHDVASKLGPDTAVVSIMHANNEVGTIQPIAEIATLAHERGILVHTDAAQSIGKLEVDVNVLGVDLLKARASPTATPRRTSVSSPDDMICPRCVPER